MASAVEYDFLDGFPEGVTVGSAEILPDHFLKGKNTFLRLELASETGTLPSFKKHPATGLKLDISVDEITNWDPIEGFRNKRPPFFRRWVPHPRGVFVFAPIRLSSLAP